MAFRVYRCAAEFRWVEATLLQAGYVGLNDWLFRGIPHADNRKCVTMDWTAPIDIYCERLGPGLWAEPVNAISNVAFMIAAFIGWREARRRGFRNGWVVALCILAFCIGIGSLLLHTVAQRWAGVADVVPILLFILTYLFAASHYLFGLRWIVAVPAAIAAFGLALLARSGVLMLATREELNGSQGYAPAFALLIGSTIILAVMGRKSAVLIGAATGVFTLSMMARIADVHLCDVFPLGTHFLWHIFNGTMIALLLVALIRHGRPATTP